MKHRVEITDQAHAEADEAYQWIARDSPQNAARWYYGLMDAVNTLGTFPLRCVLAPESEAFNREIRQLLYQNYRILFTIQERVVYILHIRHGARSYVTPADTAEEPHDE